MEIYERIRILRKEELGLSQEQFGERLGVSRSVINNIERNVLARPDQKEPIYKLICREFDINEQWLRTGEGGMFIEESEDEILAAYAAKITKGDDDFIRDLIKNYMALPEEHKQIIRKMFGK